MEKEKRRKKLDEGRIDAEKVINELMEGVDLKQGAQEEAESKPRKSKLCFFKLTQPFLKIAASGLQLFVGPDGSVSFDKRASKKNYEQVVIDGSRR